VADPTPTAESIASPELEIAGDIVKRALLVAPVAIIVCGLAWGVDGALSSAFAIGLVIGNFLLAAGLMAWAGRISPVVLAATVMGSYVVRLALITVAVLLVKDMAWVNLWPLCATLVVTHLGLLIWETKYVSASLAYPGLKPDASLLRSREAEQLNPGSSDRRSRRLPKPVQAAAGRKDV
jgi:hypothetical protein